MSRGSWVLFLVATLGACSDGTLPSTPPPPPPPTTVAVAYCAGLEPTWVAFQDGDAAWSAGGDVITRLILRRDIDVPDSTTLPVLDFASAEAFAPAVANVSLDGLGAESAASGTRLLTDRDELTVSLMIGPTTDVTRPYVALPESQLLAGDLQILAASVSAATTGSARSATLYFRTPTDRTLTLGAPLIPPTFSTVASAPALRLRAHFVPHSDYARSAVSL